MSEGTKETSFQAGWHVLVPGIKLIDFTDDCSAFVTYDSSSELKLFNSSGQELWRRKTEYNLVSISISDQLKVLAVDDNKYSILFGDDGAALWRKRPFPAQYGRISADGQEFSFITADPAIVGTSASLKVRWSYRNLMKRPKQLFLSRKAELTAFSSSDDSGDGFAGVNHSGKPVDALMGIGDIISMSLDSSGSCVLMLTDTGEIYCINVARSTGVWKGTFSKELAGVSLAMDTMESLAYGKNGLLMKLDKEGKPLWEHNLNEKLLSAKIAPDGRTIIYAVAHGEVGTMVQTVDKNDNTLIFREMPVKPLPESIKAVFQKIWNIGLSGSNERQSKIFVWIGEDGVEYSLVWDGKEKLFCINDLGEEVWNTRINTASVSDISVSGQADMAIALTDAGLLGYDLSGSELFRVPGNFKRVCLFQNASMIILEASGKCRYYTEPEHFSHVLDIDVPIRSFTIAGEKIILHSATSLFLLNSDGIIEKRIDIEDDVFNCALLCSSGSYLLCGTSGGKMQVYDLELGLFFSYNLPYPITLIEYNQELETIFAATTDDSIYVLNRRTGDMFKNALTGKPMFMVAHESGAVIGTDLDQIGLINSEGQILVRYTSPYKVTKIQPSHRKMSSILLTDEAVICIAALVNAQ